MARLYSRMNAGAIDDPQYGHIEPGEHGGFDLPGELSARLQSQHISGRPMWEDELTRQERLHGEESARRRDPETLYNAVEQIARLAAQLAAIQAGDAAQPAGQPTARRGKRTPAQAGEEKTGEGE